MLISLLVALASPAHAQDSGELVLIAVDPYGRPVEATWTLPDGEALSTGTSRTAIFVEPGRYELAVTAEGFFGTHVEVDVRPGLRSEAQAMLDASLVTLTERAIVIHDKVHFETAKAVIKPESYDLLRQVARVIIEHPELTLISVEGHADSRGGEGYNLDLSTRRARAVYQFLIAQGVSPARLRSEGFGESRPIQDEDSEEAWAKNRRVEFVIQERMDLPEVP